MKIVIVDGQGGRLGKLLVEGTKARLPQARVYALGTNSIATATMMKAGADFGATGENPVIRGVMDADAVLGPVGIVVAHAILGEVTPAMAVAVGQSQAIKLLFPVSHCNNVVVGTQSLSLSKLMDEGVELLRSLL